jgi:hypothetical protein
METEANTRILETSAVTPWPRKLFNDATAFWGESEGLHHAYHVYRALRGDYEDEFKPDGVFYVGRSPAAYLKTVDDICEEDVRVWQRFLWNQAVVPILIVQSGLKVRVYTAYIRPKQRESTEQIEAILEETCEALKLEQLLTAIEAGTIYEEKPEAFNRAQAVDRYLLENLNAAANEIAQKQEGGLTNENLEFAHLFLMRLLFVCYLIERGMIKGRHFNDANLGKLQAKSRIREGYFLRHLFDDLSTYAQRRDALCKVFARVKERFNGSLFPDSIAKEKERYNEGLIGAVNDFLHCQDLKDKQYVLGFWAYDFSVIPIETISAVYEGFVGEQGKIQAALGGMDSKRSSGAYYTPLHLAELTVDIALENIERPVHELKVFDPACGSGVFLVILFGRMVESLRRVENQIDAERRIQWARKVELQLKRLYGLDTNRTACQITCFSLYLALLEQLSPMDVEYLRRHSKTKKALHRLFADETDESWGTIHHGNLFNPKTDLDEKGFDVLIGNPPWVSREKQQDEYFLAWQKENPEVLGPEKQIAHGFMWKAPAYLCDGGIACLLLPTSVLLNQSTNKFQEEWLRTYAVERVVNFADLRHILFVGAVHPCLAIRYRMSAPDREWTISYQNPKTDPRSQHGGAIYIREEDSTLLRLKDIIVGASKKYAPTVWKSRFWGSWRDERFLSRLRDLPKLSTYAGTPAQRKRWIRGQGCQPYTANDAVQKRKVYVAWWDDKLRFLDASGPMDLIIGENDLVSIPPEFERLRTSPNKRLFKDPKVVITQGSRDMKVAFCKHSALFRHSIQAIAGPQEDVELLHFLDAVIKSDLMQYYLFHTAANWGTERDKVHFHELLSLPFFLPEDASDPQKARNIVDAAGSEIVEHEQRMEATGWLGRAADATRVRKVLEPLVREYYGIDKYEAMLIEDTLALAMKSFHPGEGDRDIPTLRMPKDRDCRLYAQTLCEMLNNFGRGSGFKVNGEVIKGEPYSVVRLWLTDVVVRSVEVGAAGKRLAEVFKQIRELLERRKGGFTFCQNLKVFNGDELYVLKPMQMRFWSRTAAMNDADEIAGAILDSREST